MQSKYAPIIAETNEKIKRIRERNMQQIAEEQYKALEKTKQDFTVIGWGKYWRCTDLHKDGQYERLEQSITDTKLKLAKINDISKTGTIDDLSGSYKVSGAGCSCADFVYRGLPCKHMYFLAGILAQEE